MSDARFDHSPWLYWSEATDEERAAQREHQAGLAATGAVSLGADTYVSPRALLGPTELSLGDRCYIAAHAYVTDELGAGDDCTVNPYAVVRGKVTLGDGVRIGAHAQMLGFNHSTELDNPIHRQPLTSRGIRIGDDVWVGGGAILLDGVSVGDHCIVGAGSVVTRDVPAWAVVGGNPARVIRDRRTPRGGSDLPRLLRDFAATARADAAAVLERAWDSTGEAFRDEPHAPATVRAHCDAIEIAALLTGAPPPQLTRVQHVERLLAMQDPKSGLVPEAGQQAPQGFGGPTEQYHVLSVGYALDLLGAAHRHPIAAVRDTSADELVAALDSLPWRNDAWGAGAWIDSWATAAVWNHELGHPCRAGAFEALLGWLATRADPATGLWGVKAGAPRVDAVNGFYRASRGTFAQAGVPLTRPRAIIDTALEHAADERYFAVGRLDACNVLDVAHPLWLAGQQDGWRRNDVRAWVEPQLRAALSRWQPGAGMAFADAASASPARANPGLQGTEMWLGIVWILADLLGMSEGLGFRPAGVHRPEPRPGAPRAPSPS